MSEQLDKIAIIKQFLNSEQERVRASALDCANDLERAAKALRAAATGTLNLNAVTWYGKSYNIELATRADHVREMLHLLDSMEGK